MKHYLAAVALLLSLICACGSHAQISVTPKNDLGEPIIASTPFEGTAYDWRVFAVDENDHLYFHGAKTVVVDGGKQVYIWAIPGKYVVEFTGAGGKEGGIHRTAEPFSVSDKPGPPGPGPKPTPISLRSLVDTSTATLLAEFYSDLARAVAKENTIIVKKFRDIHNQNFDEEWAKLKLPVNQQLTAAIATRLDAAADINATLVGDQRTKLIDALNSIAKEFGSNPQPVPPEPTPIPPVGKIAKLVILRESADETPELTSTIARLQAVGPDYEWFKREKIRVLVYDPQQEEANLPIPLVEQLTPLNPLPEAYLLTADHKIVAHMDLDIDGTDGTPATTAAQITEFVTRNK